ncbi:Rieske (2Fe-2S) protein (plasmid) [Pseudonocardia sp. EC080610-09]|uniref:aromatic ring-hydroxylating dioxygenase subunit alpha n=1 Tax=unclassified Pseudonocardia TaxID=2619320 RepID=UPI000706477A|nr:MULTISPECIES: aromatic ring-hydroxylating dioxygenase subunit alpha [unclassified Pseudonocardia]ALL79571.1 Rieske (2Fe-2S) protein [Pseudonocardia sp. EC080610-09]ALL85475.1 Rieske (2Fe-2S) protein [Pseudonocardia sp. EC080619-01]
MSTIPRNQWYVAAYSTEIDHELFARTVCNEPILFWRTPEGAVVANSDRCVHRRFPLSQAPSRLVEGNVVCGYHGFTYAADGRCVAVPGQTRVPRTARLTPYPVVEQDSLVWIWIGDTALADETRIPRARYLDSPDYTTVRGMEPLAARFSLLVNNLLDLSHETYLHGGYIGTPEVASTPITTEVDDDAGIVYVSRHMDDAQCPPFYSSSTGLHGHIARWQDIEYTPPCLYKLHSRIAPVGSIPNPDGTDPDAFHIEVVYAITPETEHTTHDFWMVARDFALDSPQVSTFLAENNRTVVLQDVVALDILEKVIQDEPEGYQELSINIDTGGLAGRRMLARMAGETPRNAPAAPVR